MDEWSLWLTGEKHLAPFTIRNYQMELRLLSEFLCDGRYSWVTACEEEFGSGAHTVPICHEWNTHAHLPQYEGSRRPYLLLARNCSGSSTTPNSDHTDSSTRSRVPA
ncbi:hypothetical protein SAMN05192558_10444 [Actinokineospora alba]|uniref:Phage integrase, N-terminal SAM-like domain n=1 Tax=Actinokineospora alba TaxID=504798 RepID=A0A1H0L8E8_9PSEU|nr:hypothetical protein [Actinokineospora alba]TDP67229.1 hypothetical protein C8E96_2763 [Actinokineospora alba]SDJ03557.1 hypothetical protein SAMN05421871_109253 [Actinokineospora alba]SDO64273.1 hypothetical protein SAMN05192558_10444 [Actinokineospora alba]